MTCRCAHGHLTCGRANPNSLAVFCGQDEDWLFKTFGDDPVLHYILAAQGGLSEEEMEDFERKSRNNVNFGGAFFARAHLRWRWLAGSVLA